MQNLVFKGLNGEFKIVAATQYITRIKDSTKNGQNFLEKTFHGTLTLKLDSTLSKNICSQSPFPSTNMVYTEMFTYPFMRQVKISFLLHI